MDEKKKVKLDPAEPQRISCDFEIGQRIGIGGMGVVNEAFDRSLNRVLAMKSLREDCDLVPHARERFIEEAQITAQLDHPNIIPLHELARHENGNVFFTMKLVEGSTLSEIIAGRPLGYRTSSDLFESLQILLKVCDAVAFAHSRGVIHRDLKPDNIMVGSFGEVYLMDWGVAKISGHTLQWHAAGESVSSTRTADGTAVGTLSYMSPEQAAGRLDEVDERSDVFALGAILYEVLTHEPPYKTGGVTEVLEAACRCRIEKPQQRVEVGLPPILCKISMKALAARSSERYQSVGKFKADIEKFLQSGWQFPVEHFPPGAIIVHEGMLGDIAFAIVEGNCRVYRTVNGEPYEMRTLARGDVFGETAIFSKQKRTATVEAIDDVTLIQISRAQFEEDLGMGYWMGLFVRALAERFEEKEQRVLELERQLRER